jgi:hypothetical protein
MLPPTALAQRPPDPASLEESRLQTEAALGSLVPYLDDVGYRQLRERDKVVAKITTRARADSAGPRSIAGLRIWWAAFLRPADR